jgi:hypothetical protein
MRRVASLIRLIVKLFLHVYFLLFGLSFFFCFALKQTIISHHNAGGLFSKPYFFMNIFLFLSQDRVLDIFSLNKILLQQIKPTLQITF